MFTNKNLPHTNDMEKLTMHIRKGISAIIVLYVVMAVLYTIVYQKKEPDYCFLAEDILEAID